MAYVNNATNITKCIGTLSELKVDFIQKENLNIGIKCRLVLNINGIYVPFSTYISKSFKDRYYSFIEALGVQYASIKDIDVNSYSLTESVIQSELGGSINVLNNKNERINKLKIYPSKNPTKLYLISKLNNYGFNFNYISRTNRISYINIKLQGIPYKASNGELSTFIFYEGDKPCEIKLNFDKNTLPKLKKYGLYDLDVSLNSGYVMQDNIILKSSPNYMKLNNVDYANIDISEKELKNIILENRILERLKLNKAT